MAARAPLCAGVLLALCVYFFGTCTAAKANYTLPVLNETYVSKPRFTARGLSPVYEVVTLFLRGIQQKDVLPPDLLLVKNGSIHVNTDIDFGSVAQFYIGILVVLCIGLAVVLLAPCAGLIWCCSCCCCGTNRPKRQRLLDDVDRDEDSTRSRKKKGRTSAPLLAPLVLSSITCVIVAGAAIAFAANDYIEDGLLSIGHHVTAGTADLRLYGDNARTEVDTILELNYKELSRALSNVLDDAGSGTTSIVSDFINLLPFETLDGMANGIDYIRTDLEGIIEEVPNCTTSANDIVQGILDIQKDLESKCTANPCPTELQDFIKSLTPPYFDQLPDSDIQMSFNELDILWTSVDFRNQLKTVREQLNGIGERPGTEPLGQSDFVVTLRPGSYQHLPSQLRELRLDP